MFNNVRVVIDSKSGKTIGIEEGDEDIVYINGQAYMKLENLEEDEDD